MYILTIFIGKYCVLLNSVQEFIEIEAWLLLTLFIYLHNRLSSIYSIVKFHQVQIHEKGNSPDRQKMNHCSFGKNVGQNLSLFPSYYRIILKPTERT